MKKIISISESLKRPGKETPLHATAEANYDETTGELIVQLSLSDSQQAPQVVRTRVSIEEAIDVSKDIFHSWIRTLVKQGVACIEGI